MSRYRRFKPYIRRLKKSDQASSFITYAFIKSLGKSKNIWVVVQHGVDNNILAASANKQDLKKRMSIGAASFKAWQKALQRLYKKLPENQHIIDYRVNHEGEKV